MTLKLTSGSIISFSYKLKPQNIMNKLLKIGELAKRAQISVETIRFYQAEELLIPQQRSASGYRLYSSEDEQKLQFILHAKKVGFSLQEIKQLLSLRTDKNNHTCEEVKHYTGVKIAEIESKIHDLQTMKQALSNLHDACCGGDESAINCTILNSLDDPNLFLPTRSRSDALINSEHLNKTI